MKVEKKIALKNMKKNVKRIIFTTMSIVLCTFLILTTMIIISSIRNSMTEITETRYKDYHFVIKDTDQNSLNLIKDKEYIEKIYVQEVGKEELHEITKETTYNTENDINIYIKYINARYTYKYSSNIVQTLNLPYSVAINKCDFNEKVLTVYGLIEANLMNEEPIRYQSRLNLSYVLDLMIVLILVVFSILFIIILYNAFLITINERKKEYATLNSIGATEGQMLKMQFFETAIMGIIGIGIGFLISYVGANIILEMLNKVVASTIYQFRLVIDIKYIILSIGFIIFNIFISTLIPNVKASSTSIMQGIRSNKQIKHKKRKSIFEKILPIEGRMAIRNLKRNKSKYRVITILLVICMTSYIAVSTYIKYEKEVVDMINVYDVDAEIPIEQESKLSEDDYKKILDEYNVNSKYKLEYMEYKRMGVFALVEPISAIEEKIGTCLNREGITEILIIGLDDRTYNKYINEINAKNGDNIIYNIITLSEGEEELKYTYQKVFDTSSNLKLEIVDIMEDAIREDKTIDDRSLNGNFIYTEKYPEGYKELIKDEFWNSEPKVFVNMNTYERIAKNFQTYWNNQENEYPSKWVWGYNVSTKYLRIKCENVIDFSNYMEEVNEKYNGEIYVGYHTLEKEEKVIYTDVLQMILQIIISTIIIIGAVSSINIINASLCEREKEFETLASLGATKKNVNKILIYENLFIFLKATAISVIISIPIINKIIEQMENLIILNKTIIPIGSIIIFFVILFIISLVITIYSTRSIKIYRKN
ncbi:MAG: ABC transporter permease [Clostridia bacterium]|nr:ABC transporter permease [Clostridia bacterium]